jgi:uncharacterized protein (DUF1697 family)
MPVMVCLLRGVNVGGKHRIAMEALRGVFDSCGLPGAQTLIQSGNVVFRSSRRDTAGLALQIEDAIEGRYGFRARAVLRTASEMREIIGRNPFADRQDFHPGRLLVLFLADTPGAAEAEKVSELDRGPDELYVRGRELFLYYPIGIGQATLAVSKIEKTLKIQGTGRNWNTVLKLLELAERMDN